MENIGIFNMQNTQTGRMNSSIGRMRKSGLKHGFEISRSYVDNMIGGNMCVIQEAIKKTDIHKKEKIVTGLTYRYEHDEKDRIPFLFKTVETIPFEGEFLIGEKDNSMRYGLSSIVSFTDVPHENKYVKLSENFDVELTNQWRRKHCYGLYNPEKTPIPVKYIQGADYPSTFIEAFKEETDKTSPMADSRSAVYSDQSYQNECEEE